jgi:hypothetical protein
VCWGQGRVRKRIRLGIRWEERKRDKKGERKK